MIEACICSICQNAAGNFVGNLFGGIFTHISNPIILVRKCNNNVDNLKNKVAELKDEKETVENYAEAVDRRGEQIAQKLRNWQTSANKLIEAADDLVTGAEGNAKKCFFGLCLNPMSRYQLSKKAKENSETIVDLVGKARGFDLPLSHIPAPPKKVAAPVKGFEDFYSRKDVLERIMGALQSQSSSIIGVHGMPGMGKTMLAKEIKRKAERDKLFDLVVMALFSRNADLKKIQVQIARGLGLDQLPNEITTEDAAERIKERLKKMKKVLIILDDIWGPGINLEELGIPLRNEPKTIEGSSSIEEYAECKILLTSRDSNVLLDQMGSQQNFPLHQLQYEEAWELLKRIVGDRAECDEIHSTATEIVRVCGGLPLAITAMAKALKNKEPYEWMDAVRILKRPSSENFDGISANVYSAIEVSYSHLESEKLKKTFLLCCLMGHKASIKNLLKYGVGLGLFANTIEEARDEVFTLISKLRASSLLIDDSDNNRFDMHDLIQDVAVSMACRDRHGLLITGDHVPKEWSDMETMKDFKWIWLQKANINELPDEFESPQLIFFCLVNNDPSLKIPAEFFKGMQRLKVLDLTEMHFSSLPSSICLLKNLHILCFSSCLLGDISIIGKLKNLEVLTISNSNIEELPREIGDLTQLKLLDLSNCFKLKIIPRHVLASLSKLEELYLANSFHQWEVEENENQRNASLGDLKHLKKLTALELRIDNVQMIPKKLFSEKLMRYKILIGDAWYSSSWYSSSESLRILKLHMDASISSDHSVKLLLKMNEELHLRELAGVKNVVDELNPEGFQDLKYLYIRNAPEVQHIIKSPDGVLFNAFPKLEVLFLQNLINLEKIFQGLCKETAFNKLRMITVERCDKLKNLFSSSIARQLLQLREISVAYCSEMEEIVDGEEQGSRNDIVEATDQLKFGEVLRSLTLTGLPELIGIKRSCRGMQLFNEQVAFPNLEELQLSGISVNNIWPTSITSSYVEKLTKLIINGCDNLKYLFSYSMARDLEMLGHLEIHECKKMREVLFTENIEENGNLIFPQLRFLLIQNLPKLRGFCCGNYIKFPCLSRLSIKCCPVLKTFISGSTFGYMTTTSNKAKNICTPLFDAKVTFTKLEQLILESMGSLDQIWDNQLDANSFCQLNQLSVGNCGKLLNIFPFSMLEKLQSLDNLMIWNCDSLEEIFESQGVGVSQSQAQNNTHSVEPPMKFVFSTLTCLVLDTLPKLRAFCHQMHTIECPSLEVLNVSKCDQVQTFASELLSFPRTKGDNDKPEIQAEYPLFWTSKATFPSLKELELHRNGIMKEIWHGKYSGDYFPKLTRTMIRECDMLKEIVACVDDKEKDGIIVFSQLKHLELCGLPRLASFCSTNCSFEFASLEEVIVMGCPNMEIFSQGECNTPNKLQKVKFTDEGAVDDNEDRDEDEAEGFWEGNLNSTIQKMFTEKAGYHGLENLEVSEFPELIEIWNKKSQEILPFKRLKSLEICNYNSLRYLPTTSMALGFAQLKYLEVANCAAMEQVLSGEGAKETFPWLISIYLESCPNLKCFYGGSSKLEFPSLYEIGIADCPVLFAFASSFPSEQEKEITTNDRESEEKPSDIPTQPFFSDKATFPSLENLKLEGNNIMKEVWCGHHPGDYFPNLQNVELINFTEQSAVLPPFFVQSLPYLSNLVVSNASFDEIFQCEGVGAEENPANALPWLRQKPAKAKRGYVITWEEEPANALTWFRELKLSKLHELKYLWKEELHLELVFYNLDILEVEECSKLKNLVPSFISFENLTTLKVSKCHGLIHVVGYSTAKSMVHLTRMSISECDMIDEIVAVGDEEMKDGICFNDLEYLELCCLPKLASFCSRNCGFDFPSLEEVIVMECPNMQVFSTRQLSTPELQQVKLKDGNDECYWYGDLNSTIQHLFMEKSGCDSDKGICSGYEN